MWVCVKMAQITSCIGKIITLINMNTDKIFVRGGQPYEAPSVTPLDILSEGLLCQSGEFKLNDWENDNESLDF